MRGGSLALLLVVASLGEASAQAKVDRIEIVETGLYVAETVLIEHAPLTATGQRNILNKTTLLAPSTRIEAKVGVHFGMRYRVVGRPSNATIKLTSVTQYPVPGLKKPGSQAAQHRGEHSLFATISAINYRGYVFEHDWELVPGTWTFELWDGKRKLASQTFDVVKP
jgi:hypothetical protein